MNVAAVRAAFLAALVEGALRSMILSNPRVAAALAAVSLTLIGTSLLVISVGWRPARSDQAPAPARARAVKAVDPTSGSGPIPTDSAGASTFTVTRSVFHRTTTRPGIVQPSRVVDLYPKVSGELRGLSVEIGDRVREGQVVAVIDAPELRAELRKSQAMVELARARARRVGIAVRVAEATLLSERAKVDIAAAEVRGSEALRRRREMERKRLKELADRKTLERRLIDEEDKWLESAQENYQSRMAQLAVARADVQAAEAKLESARAEDDEARAEVRVAEANQANPERLSVSARVIAPLDGIVTARNFDVGAVVRPEVDGDSSPLLTIVQVSRVRVVVAVPDRDATLLDKGDPVTFRPDALPDRTYQGTISRTAVAENNGTLRAEIDLDNADGRLRPGQAGPVTITLEDHPGTLTIPMSAIPEVGDGPEPRGSYSCYRIEGGQTVRTSIRLGVMNPDTHLAEVLDGLSEGDTIVVDGQAIQDQDSVRQIGM
jgi:HlyD family secretion protein